MYKINGLIVVSMLGLTACGGGGSGGPSVVLLDGVFKDSNVSGLGYESGGRKSVTDAKGVFKYEEGDDVSFMVGGIDLGTAKGKAVMTPVDLVGGGTLSSPKVINITRFLMMLDKNADPDDGIEISTEMQALAKDWSNVDFAADNFLLEVYDITLEAQDVDVDDHRLPDETVAIDHLKATLSCANAGAFIGLYAGTESGNVAFVVNPGTGEVNGSSYNPDNQESVEVHNSIAVDFGTNLVFVSGEDSAKVFSGSLDTTETISGAWENSSDIEEKGTFTADRLEGSSSASERYAVSFNGHDKGVFTFDLDQQGNVKGTSYSVSTNEENAITGTLLNDDLKATSVGGLTITGKLKTNDESGETTLEGIWSNFDQVTTGTFIGKGCQLN